MGHILRVSGYYKPYKTASFRNSAVSLYLSMNAHTRAGRKSGNLASYWSLSAESILTHGDFLLRHLGAVRRLRRQFPGKCWVRGINLNVSTTDASSLITVRPEQGKNTDRHAKHYWPGARLELAWGFSCEDGSVPCGVLALLSSKPRDKSFLGAFTVDTSSVMPICFCRLRFLLHSSWQSCHKGRLEKKVSNCVQCYFLTTPQNC